MKTLILFTALLTIASTAFGASPTQDAAIACVLEQGACPADDAARREVYSIAMTEAFRIVGSFELPDSERARALKIADAASSFILSSILGKPNAMSEKTAAYNLVMSKVYNIVGDLNSTEQEIEAANALANQATAKFLAR